MEGSALVGREEEDRFLLKRCQPCPPEECFYLRGARLRFFPARTLPLDGGFLFRLLGSTPHSSDARNKSSGEGYVLLLRFP